MTNKQNKPTAVDRLISIAERCAELKAENEQLKAILAEVEKYASVTTACNADEVEMRPSKNCFVGFILDAPSLRAYLESKK